MAARWGTRAGAAVFALGVSLTGPQSLGLAVADNGDDGNAVISAGTGEARGGAANRSARAPHRADVGPARSAAASRQAPGPAAARAAEATDGGDRPGAEVPVTEVLEITEVLEVTEVLEDTGFVEGDTGVVTEEVPVEEPLPVDPVEEPVEKPTTDAVGEYVDVPLDDPGVPVKEPADDSGTVVDPVDSVDVPRWDWNWEGGQPLPWWRGTDAPGGGDDDGVVWALGGVGEEGAPVPVAGAGVSPAPLTAADVQQSVARLNTAVVGLFESVSRLLAALPANPISELLSGALLLVRRTLFNQLPTAEPSSHASWWVLDVDPPADDYVEGNLNALDPEGDALTYRLVEAPLYGTVTIDAEGVFRYSPSQALGASRPPNCPPGPGGCPVNPVQQLNDSFTVAVSDGGFNLLDPSSDRAVEVTVEVPIRAQTTLPETPEFFPAPGPVVQSLGQCNPATAVCT